MPKGRTAAMARLAARFGQSARSAPINFTKPLFRNLKATESILRSGFASQGQLCPGFHVFQDDFNLLAHKKAARAMTQTALKPSFGIQR